MMPEGLTVLGGYQTWEVTFWAGPTSERVGDEVWTNVVERDGVADKVVSEEEEHPVFGPDNVLVATSLRRFGCSR